MGQQDNSEPSRRRSSDNSRPHASHDVRSTGLPNRSGVNAISELRIAVLTWRDLDHPEAGGAEVFAERTAAVMAERGHQVTLFSSAFAGGAPEVHRHGFRIVRRGGRYSVYPHAMWFMWRHRREFDVVIDVQNGVPFWSPLVYRRPVVALVHHVHREQWFSFFPRPVADFGWFLESRIAPFVYRKATYVTVSQSSRRELETVRVPAERVSVIYSGNEAPPRILANEPTLDRGYEIVALGRLVPHKRVELAIDAVAALRQRFPEISLTVIGGGDWMGRLVAHAAERGVADRVKFAGFVDDETKHKSLEQAAVMAMPSMKEGWGLTIVEAGYHGVPAVAFRYAGGTQESILEGETGLLVDSDAEFIDAIGHLLGHQAERTKLGIHAREFALQFNWERTGTELSELIESLVN